MFSVYARHIKGSPTLPEDEEVEIFSVPSKNNYDRPFLNMTLNNELSSAGNFEFSVDPESRFIDIWQHMRTLVRVKYDDETIFFGRVLTIDRDMFRTKKIHCEGAYTFFMDSVFEGTEKGFNVTLKEYIDKLLEAHNGCLSESEEKKIYAGELPGRYSSSINEEQKIPNETQKYGANKGYKTVKEWLEELVSAYGGFMRVRYNDSDNKLYLDWMRNYINKEENDQVMSVSSNTVDLSDTVEVDNIFTYVVAVGSGYSYSDGTGGGGKKTGKYKITVSVSPSRAGTAAASHISADTGDKVTIGTIGYPFLSDGFDNWVVSGATAANPSNAATYFIVGTSDVTAVAKYKGSGGENMDARPIYVNARPRSAGTAYAHNTQGIPGETIGLSQSAFPGNTFTGWSGAVSGMATEFTVPSGTGPISITANFAPVNPRVNTSTN